MNLMEQLLLEVEGALRGRMYVLALHGALALPDICAALGSPNGRTDSRLYTQWCEMNLGGAYPNVDPKDWWQLRCSVVHQGRTTARAYSRIVFTLPDGNGNVFHRNVLGDALNLDLETFVGDVVRAARCWWVTTEADQTVIANREHLLRLRPGGMAPYLDGVPVIS